MSADTFLVILPPMTETLLLDTTLTGIKSETDDNLWTLGVVGLNTYISAPGVGMTYLDRAKHDGLCIPNAKFYHDFIITGIGDVASTGSSLVLVRGFTAA